MNSRSNTRRLGIAAALLLATPMVCASGCGSHSATAQQPPQAVVQTVAGSSLHRLLLTAQAVHRLGIVTVPAGQGSIPTAAVVYDNSGGSWVYTSPAPLTYVRAPITIRTVTGDLARVSSGPTAGTAVVTVGAAELFGLEFGVGGEP